MRIYIAGKMGGLPQFGFPLFDAAKKLLHGLGHEPISPADMDRGVGFNEFADRMEDGFKHDAMRRDIAMILTCDAIALLPNWRDSDGAWTEKIVAEQIGLLIFHIDPHRERFVPC